ncbi:hypothetical protein E4U41_003815 [Claviceps citrina]|nr:hypothetical protein E4U41_003815 [Claviceps citrina]
MAFDCLPTEIHYAIVSHLSCRRDIKALRRTSRRFQDICAAHLFASLHISPLTRDVVSFIKIAALPHLACHVRTLVWEEITGDFNLLEPAALPTVFGPEIEVDQSSGYTGWQEERGLLEDLAAQSKALFWLTSRHAEAEMRRRRDTNSGSLPANGTHLPFWIEFVEATGALHNLDTLVSRPMHPDREVQPVADGCYPLTARVVLRYLHTYRRNEEIFASKKLSFSDESVFTPSALKHLTHRDVNAFSNLNHLELRLTEAATPRESTVGDFAHIERGLAYCLMAAAKLKSLHISCVEVPHLVSGPEEAFFLSMIPTLPALLSASFESVRLDTENRDKQRDKYSHEAQPVLVDFIKRHASTLRELQLHNSIVTGKTIEKLAADPCVMLDRFVISPADQSAYMRPQKEQQLLDMINQNYPGSTLQRFPSTHHPSPDRQDGAWTALDWSLRQRILRGEKILVDAKVVNQEPSFEKEPPELELSTHCRIYQPDSGLWRDADGFLYDPETDSVCVSCSKNWPVHQFRSEAKDWAFRGSRQWDGHLGLWWDVTRPWRLHKNCKDLPYLEEIHGDGFGFDGERDENLTATSNKMCESPPYSQQLCEREDFEQISRRERAPRWQFGTHDNLTVWYWQVYDEQLEGYETIEWRFEHRNGEVAHGKDPLDFWDDWLGYQYGDEAHPTPHTYKLWKYAGEISLPLQSRIVLGWWYPPAHHEIGVKFGVPVELLGSCYDFGFEWA